MTHTTHLDVLDAAEHMPVGSTLVINDFSWNEYELLLQDLEERRSPRLSYDCGRLEVVSPSRYHDDVSWIVDKLLWVFCEIRGLPLRGFGQATWKSKPAMKGAEADQSYYILNAPRVLGKSNDIDIAGPDPPPDLMVEVDITTDSLKKLSIYAGLGIPEVWRYDGATFHFHALTGRRYIEIAESRSLPGLTVSLLMEVLDEASKTDVQATLKKFRPRFKKLKK